MSFAKHRLAWQVAQQETVEDVAKPNVMDKLAGLFLHRVSMLALFLQSLWHPCSDVSSRG
jgi:hypothetical protein